MILYPVGTSGEIVELDDAVLSHFDRHRQTRCWHREAGGLLFARIGGKRIQIVAVTGPRPTDMRTPFSYRPDRKAEQREIDAMFGKKLHYVGDWHTHPEHVPGPSGRDLKTFASRVLESTHQMNGFLFAVIGRAKFPEGLALLLHDGKEWHRLEPQPEPATLEPAAAAGPCDVDPAGGIHS